MRLRKMGCKVKMDQYYEQRPVLECENRKFCKYKFSQSFNDTFMRQCVLPKMQHSKLVQN